MYIQLLFPSIYYSANIYLLSSVRYHFYLFIFLGAILYSGNAVVNKIKRSFLSSWAFHIYVCQVVLNSLEKNKARCRKRVLGGVSIYKFVNEGFTGKVAFMQKSERTKEASEKLFGMRLFQAVRKADERPRDRSRLHVL